VVSGMQAFRGLKFQLVAGARSSLARRELLAFFISPDKSFSLLFFLEPLFFSSTSVVFVGFGFFSLEPGLPSPFYKSVCCDGSQTFSCGDSVPPAPTHLLPWQMSPTTLVFPSLFSAFFKNPLLQLGALAYGCAFRSVCGVPLFSNLARLADGWWFFGLCFSLLLSHSPGRFARHLFFLCSHPQSFCNTTLIFFPWTAGRVAFISRYPRDSCPTLEAVFFNSGRTYTASPPTSRFSYVLPERMTASVHI